MFTSKKHIDRLYDSITELHTDKERLQRIIHKQSETMRGLAVSVKQQAKVIQSLSEENRKLTNERDADMDAFAAEAAWIIQQTESLSFLKGFEDTPQSTQLRDEKGRFKKRK